MIQTEVIIMTALHAFGIAALAALIITATIIGPAVLACSLAGLLLGWLLSP